MSVATDASKRSAGSRPVLKVSDLVVHFPTALGVVRAVDEVSFSLEGGRLSALSGSLARASRCWPAQ
jgi:ABC-type glutathione transport system ATPase component